MRQFVTEFQSLWTLRKTFHLLFTNLLMDTDKDIGNIDNIGRVYCIAFGHIANILPIAISTLLTTLAESRRWGRSLVMVS